MYCEENLNKKTKENLGRFWGGVTRLLPMREFAVCFFVEDGKSGDF